MKFSKTKPMLTIILNRSPISVNHAYGQSKSGYRYLTDEGKAFKEELGWRAKELWQKEPIKDKIRIGLFLSWKDNRVRDIANYEKLITDSLQDIVIENDKQVEELLIKRQRLGYDRIMIKLWKLSTV